MDDLLARLDLKVLRRQADALRGLGSPVGTKLAALLDHFDDWQERDRLAAELIGLLPTGGRSLPRR
ncbi:hypothetical protein [Desertibaculum subflavum]|uniref:hypothetical protein n=1 Tax=Desertibaculum subflavum TaxID=2268458 RepID=UPI000E674FCD